MPFYNVTTDAVTVTIEAGSRSHAAAIFAESERLYRGRGIVSVSALQEVAEEMGGWAKVEEVASVAE